MPPVNDAFANAEVISGSGTITGTTVDSSTEVGEPSTFGSAPIGTVWYRYDAVADGYLYVDNIGTAAAPPEALLLFEVYSGTTLANLVWRDDAASWGFSPEMSFDVVLRSGTTYYVRVWSTGGLAPFTLNWTFEAVPAPVNDNWADAIALTGASGNVTGQMRGASSEGDPTDGDADVWYSIAVTEESVVRLDTVGTEYTDWGTYIDVWTGGTFAGLEWVTDSGWWLSEFHDYNAVISFVATAGVTYWVRLSGMGYEERVSDAPFTLRWNVQPRGVPPANDNWADAIELDEEGSMVVTNVGATNEEDEPWWSGGATVWFRWVAPSVSNFVFSTEGTTLRAAGLPFPEISVYREDPEWPGLVDLDWIDSESENISPDYHDGRVLLEEWAIEAPGDVFYIRVDGPDVGYEGEIAFSWGLPPAPIITSISPTEASEGDVLTITGSRLAQVYLVSFWFINKNSSTFVVHTDTEIQVPIPANPAFGRPDLSTIPVSVFSDLGEVEAEQQLLINTVWPPNNTDPYFTAPSFELRGEGSTDPLQLLSLPDNYFMAAYFGIDGVTQQAFCKLRMFRIEGEEVVFGELSDPIYTYDVMRFRQDPNSWVGDGRLVHGQSMAAPQLACSGPNGALLVWAEHFTASSGYNWPTYGATAPYNHVIVRTAGVGVTWDGLNITGVGSPTILTEESPLAGWPSAGYGLQSWAPVSLAEISDTEVGMIVGGRNSTLLGERIGYDYATMVVTRTGTSLSASGRTRIGTSLATAPADGGYRWHVLFGYRQLWTFNNNEVVPAWSPHFRLVSVGDRTLVCLAEIDEQLSWYPAGPPNTYPDPDGHPWLYAGYHRTLLIGLQFDGSTPTWGTPVNLYTPEFVGFAHFSARNSSYGLFFSASHPGIVNRTGGPSGQVSWNKPYPPFLDTFIDYPDLHDAHIADWAIDLDTLGITITNNSAVLATPVSGDFDHPIRWQRINGDMHYVNYGGFMQPFGETAVAYTWWPFGADILFKQEDGSYTWPVDTFGGLPGWGTPGWGPDIKVRGYFASGGQAPFNGTLYQEFYPDSWSIADGRILASSGQVVGGPRFYSILQYPTPLPVVALGPRRVGVRSKQPGSSHA